MKLGVNAEVHRMGTHVDGLKFAGGSFSLFPEKPLRELIDLAHEYDVYVSTVSVKIFITGEMDPD